MDFRIFGGQSRVGAWRGEVSGGEPHEQGSAEDRGVHDGKGCGGVSSTGGWAVGDAGWVRVSDAYLRAPHVTRATSPVHAGPTTTTASLADDLVPRDFKFFYSLVLFKFF
jgi:hypothetical protein